MTFSSDGFLDRAGFLLCLFQDMAADLGQDLLPFLAARKGNG